MGQVKSKVTAATLSAAVGGYVVNLLTYTVGWTVEPEIKSLVIAAITAVVVFGAGFLKREHIISGDVYEGFVGSDADREVESKAGKHRADDEEDEDEDEDSIEE